ncbi:hypothetical protein [Novosphingobium soli]|uniref:Secreted protein n=1 Tax=Novosphingobium soli TaxID=574956 RepID=A0ABV6CTV3_9SPHN
MSIFRSRIAASLAALAAFSMTAAPALARGHDDWRRHRHHRGGGGIDGGDLLAGLLVIGGVAAVATAVSNKKAERTDGEPEPYRYPEAPEVGYGDGPDDGPVDAPDDGPVDAPDDGPVDVPPSGGATYPGGLEAGQGSLGSAVDACSAELSRGDKHVESVESVRRMGERYSVEGRLADGRPFACSVDDGGHIRSVAVDGQGVI